MRRFLNLIAVVGISLGVAGAAHAQSRAFGAETFIMDDGAGHTYTLQTPTGMTSNFVFSFPIPPSGNPPAGFVNAGTAPGQTLYWDNTGAGTPPGFTGQWMPSNVITNNTNGDGTNVTITAPILGTHTGNVLGPAAPGTDGTYLTVNGANGGATEVVINGDLSVTGTLGAIGTGVFTTVSTTNLEGNPLGTTINVMDALSTGNIIPSADVTYSLGTSALRWNELWTPNVTNSGTALTLQQTGDVMGTSQLILQDRTGSNGALFTQTGSAGNLVDFGFQPGAGQQSNLRVEARPGQKINSNNLQDEFQFVDNTTGAYGFTFAVGKQDAWFGENVGINVVNASHALDVAGNVNLAGTTSELDMNGDPGTAGYMLTSAGIGLTPTWTAGALNGDVTGPFGSNTITPTAGNDIVAALNNAATTTSINNTAIGVTAGAGSFTTLTSSGNSTLGTGPLAIANSFGTGDGTVAVANMIGSSFLGSSTTVNGTLNEVTTVQTSTSPNQVNANYVKADARTVPGDLARGIVAEAYSNSTGQSFPTANAVLGVAKWYGGAGGTDNIVGVVGTAEPNDGSGSITARGVVGEAVNTNTGYGNTGVLGIAANSTATNTGVAGAANATDAQVGAFAAGLPAGFASGVVGYNPASGADQHAGYFSGQNTAANGRVLVVNNDPVGAMTPGDNSFATESRMNYPGSENTGSLVGAVGGLYALAQTSAGDYQSQGAMLEAQVTNGNGDFTHAVGGFGIVTGTSTTATAKARIVGIQGETNFPGGSNNFNGIGVFGYNGYGGTTTLGRAAGGEFDGTGAATQFGVIGEVGSTSPHQAFDDATLLPAGDKIAVVGINYNAGSATNLAAYFSGNVNLAGANSELDMTGDPGTAGYLLTSAGIGLTPTWTAGALNGDVTGPFGSNTIAPTAGNHIVAALNNVATTTAINSPNKISAPVFNATPVVSGPPATSGIYQIGGSTVLSAPGTANLFVGVGVAATNTTGSYNTVIGNDALPINIGGSNNVVSGYQALFLNTVGSANTATGEYALYSNLLNNNTGDGISTLYNNSTGMHNTAIGASAGLAIVGGSNNTFLGSTADATGDWSNATAVGYGAMVAASNEIQLGNTSVTVVNTSGAITGSAAGNSLGNSLDANQLTINGVATTGAIAANQYELTVNGDANITGTATIGTLSSQNIMFDNASPYTAGGTMTFNGGTSPTAAGTPVITISNIPSGSFGEQVNATNVAAGGIQVTGANAGTGVVIDPFPTGIAISATTTGIVVGGTGTIGVPAVAVVSPVTGLSVTAATTGATFDGGTTGIIIGGTTAPTGDGLDITSGPTSISANNLITTAANVNVGGVTNSTATTGLYEIGGSTVLSDPGTANIFVGVGAGAANTAGSFNAFVGVGAGAVNTGGSNNTASGYDALNKNTVGSDNTATGEYALFSNLNTNHNTASGFAALYTNTGSYNTATGDEALYTNLGGSNNTASGYEALFLNSVGSSNTATGEYALYSNLLNYNTGDGFSTLYNNSTGMRNTALGANAGLAIIGGNNNTFLGYTADAAGDYTNATAIGALAQVGASNSMVLGSINGVNSATASTNVGIGLTAPLFPLHVVNTATGGATLANAIVAVATSDATGQTRPAANAVFGEAIWSGGAAATIDDIIGVVGKTLPNNGVTAVGVYGESNNTNPGYGNTGVLGLAANSTQLNTGVAGAADATDLQVGTFAGTLPAGFASGIVGYNPLTTVNEYAGYFSGNVNVVGLSTLQDVVPAATLTYSLGTSSLLWSELWTPLVTSTTTDLTLQETGDVLGTSQLILQDRNGTNGALVTQTGLAPGLDVADLGLIPGAGQQSNLRLEARAVNKVNSNNTNDEFQFVDNSTGAYAYTFAVGKQAAWFGENVGINVVNPTYMLDVAGSVRPGTLNGALSTTQAAINGPVAITAYAGNVALFTGSTSVTLTGSATAIDANAVVMVTEKSGTNFTAYVTTTTTGTTTIDFSVGVPAGATLSYMIINP